MPDELKELVFLGDTRRVLKALPVSVRQKIGRALGLIQTGDTPTNVKSLRGFMAWVQEIRVRHDKEAFRAVYTASLGDRVYLTRFPEGVEERNRYSSTRYGDHTRTIETRD